MKLHLPTSSALVFALGLTTGVVANVNAGQSAATITEISAAQPAADLSFATNRVNDHPWVVPAPKFDSWPEVPPRPTNAGSAYLTSTTIAGDAGHVASSTKERQLYSFHAENVDIKSALALFAKANRLNIVPDQDIAGLVTLDIDDLPLERVMQALLEAHDISWTEEDGLIRVRGAQTRSFVVDYLRLTRSGHGSSSVTLSSAAIANSSGNGNAGSGPSGSSAGAGGGGPSTGAGTTGSQMNLNLENPVEFWRELDEQMRRMLTPAGRESLAINATAGIIQVTDRPSALKRVENFLQQMNQSVSRQVDLEAKLYDVTLGDQFQFGVDWQKVAAVGGGQYQTIASPFGDPSQLNLTRDSFVSPGGGFLAKQSAITMLFSNNNAKAVLNALKEQGNVSVISQPRLRTLNNQTAIMKVGTDQPFFTQQTQTTSSASAQTTTSGDQLSIITVGTVLSVTPQIAGDGWITLDITPAITSFVDEKTSPSGKSSAPVLDIKQSSTIVRLHDGETIIMGGLIQNSSTHSTRKVPLIGDIPLLGKLFQGKIDAKQKKELVVFLTPRIVQ